MGSHTCSATLCFLLDSFHVENTSNSHPWPSLNPPQRSTHCRQRQERPFSPLAPPANIVQPGPPMERFPAKTHNHVFMLRVKRRGGHRLVRNHPPPCCSSTDAATARQQAHGVGALIASSRLFPIVTSVRFSKARFSPALPARMIHLEGGEGRRWGRVAGGLSLGFILVGAVLLTQQVC